jgi:hypothetical protein
MRLQFPPRKLRLEMILRTWHATRFATLNSLLPLPACRTFCSAEADRKVAIQPQYNKYVQLFSACDVNGNGRITMEELRVTLFRFGLDGIAEKQLASLFVKVAAECPGRPERPERSDGLTLDGFVKFVEAAIVLKNDEVLSDGSPLWWQRFLRELRHYR